MAYKEHGMWEVLDVLRRAHRGEGRRAIARTTGRSRKTVQRYLTAAADLGWEPGQGEPGEPLAAQILAQLRPGARDRAPSEAEQRLLPHRETLRGWLNGTAAEGHPLTLTKCHALLTRRGVAVTYSSLYRFAVKHCGIGERPSTVRVAEVAPGELAEVDFGRLGLIPDGRLDRRRVLWALVITLVHSRHQYVHLSHSQTLAVVLGGLEDAWTFFGGVPARVVVDNLRAAITKADRYDPVFARVFEEYSRHRGFVIDPAPPVMPTGKPHVERQVPYVRENFFRGETFLDRGHAQREVIHWCVDTAGRRLHGTTQQRPLEVFEAAERPALRPLETERFDPPRWATVTVHPDHHIRFGRALYSVPHRYLRRTVDVRGDTQLVRIYHRGELVKTCPTQPPGGRHTDYTDYPAEKTAYAMRSERLGPEHRRRTIPRGKYEADSSKQRTVDGRVSEPRSPTPPKQLSCSPNVQILEIVGQVMQQALADGQIEVAARQFEFEEVAIHRRNVRQSQFLRCRPNEPSTVLGDVICDDLRTQSSHQQCVDAFAGTNFDNSLATYPSTEATRVQRMPGDVLGCEFVN